MQALKNFLNDESGASAAEYALILAILGAATAAGALFLSPKLEGGFKTMGNCIADPSTGNCGG